MPNLKPYLELIRIPGVFTSQADIIAGALIAGAGIENFPDLILLLVASSCFFSAGMALNDYFDIDVDKLERPTRPIPSGRIAKEAALLLGLSLLAGGGLITLFVNRVSFTIALMLVFAILTYDGILKNSGWAGPLNMGFCRYLNLLLGISILPLSLQMMLIPLMTGLYIFGITVLSSSEVKGRDPFAVTICLSSIVGVAFLYGLYGKMDLIEGQAGIYFCIVWMVFAIFFPLRLYVKTTSMEYQKAIKWLLLLLVILDGVIVVGMRSVAAAIIVFLFIFPGGYIARRFYVT